MKATKLLFGLLLCRLTSSSEVLLPESQSLERSVGSASGNQGKARPKLLVASKLNLPGTRRLPVMVALGPLGLVLGHLRPGHQGAVSRLRQ